MSWLLSVCVAEVLLVLCWGENTVDGGINLSPSGYHLCVHNETKTMSFLVVQAVPYTETKPCGGWLLWTTCTVTLYKMTHQIKYKAVKEQVTRCCDGYVQVGPYCTLSVNRSDEFTAKPGSCPTADGAYPRSEDCEFDFDCPGWQKCCQRSGGFLCSHPTSSKGNFGSGESQWNATVMVKTDYQELISRKSGLLNLTRVLQATVIGALQLEVSIFYLDSWPIHPFRTATSLLIRSNFTLSLLSITSKLNLLLKLIPEVSSVTVQDVDECAHPALHQCTPQAVCNNTSGSYQCVCHQRDVDVHHNNSAVNCTGDFEATSPQLIYLPARNTTSPPPFSSTEAPPGNATMGIFISSETSVTAALINTSSVTSDLSRAPLGTSSAAYTSMSSAAHSPLPTTACPLPAIRRLWSANVTGTSMSVCWSSQFQTNQTFQVTLTNVSGVSHIWETTETMVEVMGLQPGGLYNVTVTPWACGRQGFTLHMLVRTAAQTLDATTRLTNIQFSADLRDTSSQAYKNLTESFLEEIYRSLSPEIKAMVDSGQVRIEIRGFSLGSVVVNFTIIFSQSQSQPISNISTALLDSLMNSTRYTVDSNNTSINDSDECTSGENDCSQSATCTNTWASYTCACFDGFTDYNPERPGRTCQANVPLDPTAATSGFSTVSTAPDSQTTLSTPDLTSTVAQATLPASATHPTSPTLSNMLPTTTSRPTTVFSVPTSEGAISVLCRVADITVTLAKAFLLNANIQESALYLGEQECGVNGGNATHVQLTVAWDECATRLVHNETSYTASVVLYNSMDPYTSLAGSLEAPRIQLEVPIMCTYLKSMLISADFGSLGYDIIKDIITGLGSFQVMLQLTNGTALLPHNVSLSPEQALVVEVSLSSSSEQIKVIMNQCWATPTLNLADTNRYTFLENSCATNSYTKVLMNGKSTTSRVSVQIFSFVNLKVIYLHCQVQICLQIGSETCVPDCFQRSARTSNIIRTAFGSSGPIQLDEESLEEKFNTMQVIGLSCLGVGLSLFFIFGFVCLFYCQRNRIGHYNFSVKPKQENFTYLVFNT
ncbi:uromodulin-like 1 [Kryptolebias marmoratus]|uniref:uromodulin-like 1 n=1 Tax=Kryptolebias marmoratus TaxID=37003 RepID=UPI0007F8FE22|nr:uromodulin-like 1 [Kryptolebias marmoratus]